MPFFRNRKDKHKVLTVSIHTIYDHHGKVCLRQRDLPNYRKEIFKTQTFMKLIIKQWWQYSLFLSVVSQNVF